MGTNVIITKNGEYVTEVGRSHIFQNYNNNDELDTDYDELESQVTSLEQIIIKQVKELKVFVQSRENLLLSLLGKENINTGEVLDDMVHEIIICIRENSDDLMKIGKKQMLSYILDDETMSYEIS
jgi:hypothetical protein